MSYDISVVNSATKKVVELEEKQHFKGGIYCIGGTKEATLNITYNYGSYYYKIWENGLWSLHEVPLNKALPMLEQGFLYLGTKSTDDYWQATKGNAGLALYNFYSLCSKIDNKEGLELEVV